MVRNDDHHREALTRIRQRGRRLDELLVLVRVDVAYTAEFYRALVREPLCVELQRSRSASGIVVPEWATRRELVVGVNCSDARGVVVARTGTPFEHEDANTDALGWVIGGDLLAAMASTAATDLVLNPATVLECELEHDRIRGLAAGAYAERGDGSTQLEHALVVACRSDPRVIVLYLEYSDVGRPTPLAILRIGTSLDFETVAASLCSVAIAVLGATARVEASGLATIAVSPGRRPLYVRGW
jgi:hypothetical protein